MELQALQRGRGINRPRLKQWAGPLLQQLIGGSSDGSEQGQREALVALLSDGALALPTDLRYLFLVACGIESDEPMLQQRLAAAGEVLDRNPRSLSRHLRRAEALMAELLLQTQQETDPYDTGGWATTRLVLDIRMDLPRPRAAITQVIRATRENQREFRHTVAVALPTPAEEAPTVKAVSGCRLVQLEPLSNRSWVAHFAVPSIDRGRSHSVAFETDFPGRGHLLPFAAFAPIRPCASMDVRVGFGTPPFTTSVWRVNAIPPPLITDRPRGRTYISLVDGVATASFTNLRPGYAYGLAWSDDL